MSLKKEFKNFLADKPVLPYATLPTSGVDVEWSDLMNAWKIDMGMSVEEFLKRNPDIKSNIINNYPGLAPWMGEKITSRTVMKRGLAEAILAEMIEATDVPGEADRVFKGQRLRNIASGTLTAEARNEIYENAQKTGQLPERTTINPEGGVRQSSIPDLSDYPRKGGHATRKAKELNLTEYTWKGDIYKEYGGDRWVNETQKEGRRARERRGGKEEFKQRVKEETRLIRDSNYEPLTTEQIRENAKIKANAAARGMDADHLYDKAFYDSGRVNDPEFRQALDPKINRGIKKKETLELSRHFLRRELQNPSESMPLEETLDAALNPQLVKDKSIRKGYTADIHEEGLKQHTKSMRAIGRASKFTSATDSAVRLASGDVIGGSLGLVMQTPAFQKAITKTLAKSGAKIAPGVGIGLSSLEAAGYSAQGRWTQAGIAALSGVVGEIPLAGDLVSAGLDLTNTTIDVLTGNVKPDLDEETLLRKTGRTRQLFNL
tara:strand:- start:72 stop:1541 length:1470 start_codon:yes stop_codon:yes gene_type:complete